MTESISVVAWGQELRGGETLCVIEMYSFDLGAD